jgi:hypothetical protein
MAKKRNDDDDINEEFGQDSSDDINEADDNFGLPDVEYKTLDESDEPKPESEGSESEKKSQVYSQTSYSSEERASSNSGYEPPKAESIAPKLILFAVLLIIAAGAIWYFGFYSPAQKKAEKARIEQQRQAAEAEEAARRAEQQRLARERAVQDSLARVAAAQAEVPEVGIMTTISGRTGRYYVVVGSFVDDDLAKDLANKLGQDGINTSLIPPWGTRKFYRLTMSDLESFDEAQARADELKPTYGEGLWVLKY